MDDHAVRAPRRGVGHLPREVVTGGALWAVGLQQALLWGLLAGIFNSIPYYGPLLMTAGLSVVGYLQFGTIGMTAAVAGVSLLITTLEGSLLTPMLMGRASSMNQVAVFAGLLFWSWVWGVWGMLLAVPVMMVVKVIGDHVEPLQPSGIFSDIDCGFLTLLCSDIWRWLGRRTDAAAGPRVRPGL